MKRVNSVNTNVPDLIISKANIVDAEDIVHFLNMAGGESDFLTFGLNDFPVSIAEEKEIITECNLQEQCLMLVGKINGEIISQLFLERSNNLRLSHIGTLGITVAKKYWRRSIGKKMILAAIDWAKLSHLTKLQLYVRTDNVGAIDLYKKLGFDIEGTITRAVKIENKYFDNYLMGLHL